MESQKTVIIQGVRFRFTMGAIAKWCQLTGKESVTDYILDALTVAGKGTKTSEMLERLGAVLLASYQAGGFGYEQPIKIDSSPMLWDWLDDILAEEKTPLFDALFNSVKQRLDDIQTVTDAIQGDGEQGNKKKA